MSGITERPETVQGTGSATGASSVMGVNHPEWVARRPDGGANLGGISGGGCPHDTSHLTVVTSA